MSDVCSNCRKKFAVKVKPFNCCMCEAAFHPNCAGFPETTKPEVIEILKDSWACSKCKSEFVELKNENLRLLNENRELKNRMDRFESQLQTIKGDLKNEIVSELSASGTASSGVPLREEIFACIREERERDLKKMNICISNLPEESGRGDAFAVAEVFRSQMGIGTADMIVKTTRLGAETVDKPRMLIVTISNMENRRKIFQNAHKLKNYRTATGKKIFISPDMTRMQREENKKLNDELWLRRGRGERVHIYRGKIVNSTRAPQQNRTRNE